MDPTLLEKAMALYEQEQQQQSTPDCLHIFEYDSSYGQRVCFNCDVIDPSPLLTASPDYLYTPRSKSDKTAYLKKCIAEHEERCNALFHVKYTKPLSAFSCVLSECSPKNKK